MTIHADDCTEFRELASCRLDGELDELGVARLEEHLLTCVACTAWTDEVAAWAELLRETESELPAFSFSGQRQALRRRFVRAAAVGATAACAAAVAAFALVQPGSGLFFSSASSHVAALPCISCTKKQTVTFGGLPFPAATAPVHVTNPLVERE
ncbi:MAG TPA: zf-HC2 domain-containing protein [Gaiellaceae bacterium]|nr:zf-HC2 domain-containing protein [Gaiellaceae bacterium]